MSKVEFSEDRCKGCMLCTLVCPKNIIEQSKKFNKQGYKIVEIKEENLSECIGCGFCAEICPDCVIEVWRSKKG